MKKHTSSQNANIWKIADAAVLAVLLITLAAIGITVNHQKQPEEEAVQELVEEIPENTADEEAENTGEEITEDKEPELPEYLKTLTELNIPVPDKEVDFEDLQENVNEDIYAWIYIPDSKIDYPVLQHPIDNYHYLNYNLDGSYGYPGCIYTESYNKRDFSDPLTVMYGHNMKNGTMFAGLHKYEDTEYFNEHPYVYIYTPDKLYVYRIFASNEYSSEHLLYRHDYTSETEFENYIDKMAAVRGMNCNRAEDVEVTADNHILVLSTCMADKPDNRYLVQGVLLNEN